MAYTLRVLSLAFCAAMAALPGWAQADATADQYFTPAEKARIEALLKNRSVLLVPKFMVPDNGLGFDVVDDYQIVAVPFGGLLEAIIRRWVIGGASPEEMMRAFLLFDRAYRAELARDFNISLPAPVPAGAAGTATDEGAAPPPPVLPDAVLPFVWAGGLDGDELADVTARFNARAGQTLQGYSATPMTLILDPSGTVEIAGQAFCEVKTRTDTTNGQDFVMVRTVTSYETDGQQVLSGYRFDVRVRIQRWAENSGGPVGAPGDSVSIYPAELKGPDASGARLLRIYNGQPSVGEAAWRLMSTEQ